MPAGSGRAKEPHHFCPDLYSPRYVHDRQRYEALFDCDDARSAKRVGEASVFYLYSEQAPTLIHEYSPDARIVAMLRNPVDMIHSLHSQRLFSGHEEIEDFAEALAAEPERARGERLPAHGHPVQALQYRRLGRYASFLQRYLDTFGPERVHVILFDDFTADTPHSYRSLLQFLEVDPAHVPDFRVVNPNSRVRSTRLRNFLKFSRWSTPLKAAGRRIMSAEHRRALAARIQSANQVVAPRPAMHTDLRRSLIEEFAPHNRQLEALLGRDLGTWLPSW